MLNNFSDADMRKKLTAQLLQMEEDVYRLLSEIVFMGTERGPDNITVYMDDGFEVRPSISNFAEKMDYYPEITAQLKGMEKGVIDMEVGTFFIPYSEIYGVNGEEEPIEEESE